MRVRDLKFSRWGRYLGAGLFGLVLAVAAISVDAFERMNAFSRQHEGWELDEVFTVLVALSFVFGILLYLRANELGREVVRRRAAEHLAEALARHDPLTGLPNRRYFDEAIDRFLAHSSDRQVRAALFFIDVDRFKMVNDNLGHDAGDILLQAIADRLQSTLRSSDFLARIGGDEFAVLMVDPGGGEEIANVGEWMLMVASDSVRFRGHEICATLSIGISQYPDDGENRETLVQAADIAMYQAKEAGRDHFVVYDRDSGSEEQEQRVRGFELQEALHAGEVRPYYQAVLGMRSGSFSGLEVLARWQHPRFGLLDACDFVPLADNTGLTQLLFETMLHQACRDALNWPADISIAVNVSSLQLRNRGFAALIMTILEEVDFPPERLSIEVTEDALCSDLETTRETLLQIQRKGITIALDLFRTGYFSFRNLSDMPIDWVKIDRSFIRGVGKDHQSEEIVASTIRLCRALGLKTVADGVEGAEQAEWLAGHGADAAQGYYYAMPVPADDVLAVLNAKTHRKFSKPD